MPNRKDWQPEDTQVETAAMALRAQQMRLWNLVEDSATVGRCWQQTPVWLRCEYRQMASAMLRAVHQARWMLSLRKHDGFGAEHVWSGLHGMRVVRQAGWFESCESAFHLFFAGRPRPLGRGGTVSPCLITTRVML